MNTNSTYYKACSSCGQSLPLTRFGSNVSHIDGLQNNCIECQRRAGRESYYRHKDERLAYQRLYEATNPERKIEGRRRWYLRNPNKAKAHRAVRDALKACQIQRPDRCEKCGVVGAVQAHHADYARPLDVSWLCISCHRDIHRIGATDGE